MKGSLSKGGIVSELRLEDWGRDSRKAAERKEFAMRGMALGCGGARAGFHRVRVASFVAEGR